MIKLSPVPLYWRITDLERKALRDFQLKNWELNLEIPPYLVDLGYVNWDREMKIPPRHPKRVK